jgi:integrase
MAERLFLRGKTWWCWGYDIDGERWQKSTKQREKAAAKIAARAITHRHASSPDQLRAQKITLERALSGLLESLEKRGREPATLRAAEYHCRHLITHLDPKRPLGTIGLDDTTPYLEKRLEEGASRHTAAKELRTLQQAWRRLAKLKMLPPCPDLVPDELGTVYTPRNRWLTQDEYAKLLAAMDPKSDGRREIDRRDYVVAWCHLGLRKSELFSIRPGDYDHARRELRVRGTKTEGADRLIPVSDVAAAVLVRRCKLDTPFPDWALGSVTRDLAAASARAGIDPVTPNDLRRTFCSWLCQRGVPERACADLLGHANTNMVRAVYGHLDRETLASAVAKLPKRTVAGVAKKPRKRK